MNTKAKSDASSRPFPQPPSSKSTPATAKPGARSAAPETSVRPSSVPISVYRELAAELKNTRILLEAVTAQNQQLLTQNQQLRHEAEQILVATQSLQALVKADVAPPVLTPDASAALSGDADGVVAAEPAPQPDTAADTEAERLGETPNPQSLSDEQIAAALHRVFAAQGVQVSVPESLQNPDGAAAPAAGRAKPKVTHTEQGGHKGSSTRAAGAPREMNNLWLILTVIVVIVTAFGAGFLMVLPFIQQPNNSR